MTKIKIIMLNYLEFVNTFKIVLSMFLQYWLDKCVIPIKLWKQPTDNNKCKENVC